LLEHFRVQSGGASLEVNLKLVRNNVRLATQIAAALV
jgi:pseudouridine-5'-phosphate glycosidase